MKQLERLNGHRGIRDSRIILSRFDLGAMLNDTAEKGERETGPNDGDKVAGRSVSRGDVASHARSVEGPHFPNVKFPFDSPVYERRVISLRHARNSTEIYRIATKD